MSELSDLSKLNQEFQKYALEHRIVIHSFEVAEIEPKESVRLKCLVPLCEYYGVCKVCPPNIPEVWQFERALKDFTKAYLVVLQEKVVDLEKFHFDFSAELKLAEIILDLERTSFNLGYYQALGLIVGGCKYCEKCVPLNQPCKHPFKARPSPEGFGIDITAIAQKLGVAVEWPPTNTVTFLGLMLI